MQRHKMNLPGGWLTTKKKYSTPTEYLAKSRISVLQDICRCQKFMSTEKQPGMLIGVKSNKGH